MAWLLASLSLLLAVPVAYVLLSDVRHRGLEGVLSLFSEPSKAQPKAEAHFVGPAEGYPLARCLDGSSGLYYFSEGTGSGASKFQVFHEGGGFCASDADCLKRSHSSLGSTAKDSSTMDFGSLNNLKLSRSQDENPLMYNWNHVYLRYCDGGYFSGEAAEPVKVGDSLLYFRGKHITQAVFQDLTKFGFSNATDIVISGCSAGAIRVFAHLDALKDMASGFSPSAKVVGLPDSGFYMDLDIFTPLKRYVVKRQAATSLLNAGCAAEHRDHLEKCLIGSVVATFLKTPFFVFQSRFDLDQQSCEMGAACRASKGCIMDYAANLTEALHQAVTHPQRGVFLDSCPRHCSYGKRPLDDKSGLSQLQAFSAWYRGGESKYGQGVVYKCDKCCHGRSGDIPNQRLLPFV